ncbi:8-oxo-dGTP diphosphatase [Paenibacillus sp. GCM10027629]
MFSLPSVEMTNMCMIYDPTTDKVLVQDRIKSWKGIAFPGGHIEDGESIIDSTIREIKEETGLTISDLELCGIVYWYNDATGDRYLVFSYRTEVFSGQLLDETEEGRLFWVDKNELSSLPLSEGLKERIPLFLDNKYSEGFGIWNEHHQTELKLQ